MFEQNYTLELPRGEKLEKYHSLFPSTMPNLFYIKGHNTFGKTKFMDMIAAGMHGHEEGGVKDPVMKKRISDLLDPNKNKLKFNFMLENKSGSVKLFFEKKNYDTSTINVKEVVNNIETPIGNSVKEKYTLIYDIPHNPVSRIIQLSKNIRDDQGIYYNKLELLEQALDRKIKEISESLDLTQLENIKKDIENRKEELKILGEKKKNNEILIDGLDKLISLRLSTKFQNELKKIQTEINGFTKDLNKKRRKISHGGKEIHDAQNFISTNLSGLQNDIKILREHLEDLFPKEKILKLFSEIDIYNHSTFKLPENLNDLIDLLSIKVEKEKESLKKDNKGEYFDLCEQILQVLQNYNKSDINLFGKPVDHWIKEVEKVVKSNKHLSRKKELITNCDEVIKSIRTKIELINSSLSELKKLRSKYPDLEPDDGDLFESTIRVRIEKLEEEEKNIGTKAKINSGNYERLGRPTIDSVRDILKDDFNRFATIRNENELKTEFDILKDSLETIKQDIISNTEKNNYRIEQYNRMKKQTAHPLKKFEKNIKDLVPKVQKLRKRFFDDYKEWVEVICDNDPKMPDSITREQEKYYKLISEYLAKVIDVSGYQQKEYKLKKIDFFEQKVIWANGTFNYFSDVGGGENQVMLLKGMIKTAMQYKKKMVVILDEVAMMSDPILEPIFNILNKCFEKDQLLLGVLIKPLDEKSLYYKSLINNSASWVKVAERDSNGRTRNLISNK